MVADVLTDGFNNISSFYLGMVGIAGIGINSKALIRLIAATRVCKGNFLKILSKCLYGHLWFNRINWA